ncbi:hypothetical protein [Pedobacter sp. AK013]|uniref:hypothetical protein n=1 Tax=Pedobacter sp. AK013 TaxID=2723071 RepID=UPI00161455FA|nr:hypothetical protein [Pedobacter sp. AK013]
MPIFPSAEAGAGLHLPSNAGIAFQKKPFKFRIFSCTSGLAAIIKLNVFNFGGRLKDVK